MGNLALLIKLAAWWNRFMSILKGEVPIPPKVVDEWAIQLALLKHGYPVQFTGKMDDQTREALKKVQQRNGLEVDGLFGPKTQEALGL